MLTPYLPFPPASGGQIRTFNLLKHLSQSHEVHLVCLYKYESEKKYIPQLEQLCHKVYLCKRAEKPWQLKNVLKSIFGVLPFLIVRNYSAEAREVVEKLLQEISFDVIHAETFYIMPHIPETKVPILLVEQTIEYRVYKHFIESKPWYIHHPLRLDTYKLKRWERHYWEKADLVAAVSDTDAEAIRVLAPTVKPVVIPNGAGDEMFEDQILYDRTTLDGQIRLLFVGNFSWLQNSEAADMLIYRVFPELKKKVAAARLIIAGQNPPQKYRDLQDPSMEIIELAADDTSRVRELYATSTIFVAPIYGPGGTRLKVLAAMASRLPIVTTLTGATGLHLEPEKAYLHAETIDEFVRQIERMIHDSTLQKSLADNAYTIAKEKYSWSSITDDLINAYHSLGHHV